MAMSWNRGEKVRRERSRRGKREKDSGVMRDWRKKGRGGKRGEI